MVNNNLDVLNEIRIIRKNYNYNIYVYENQEKYDITFINNSKEKLLIILHIVIECALRNITKKNLYINFTNNGTFVRMNCIISNNKNVISYINNKDKINNNTLYKLTKAFNNFEYNTKKRKYDQFNMCVNYDINNIKSGIIKDIIKKYRNIQSKYNIIINYENLLLDIKILCIKNSINVYYEIKDLFVLYNTLLNMKKYIRVCKN